jgi:hypothetical protein
VATKPIEIDLRRDLPKVREQLEDVLPSRGNCRYSAPCAVGAMLSPAAREALRADDKDGSDISVLLSDGTVRAPADQKLDIDALQEAFDNLTEEAFLAELARLEAKYLTEQAA